MVNVKIMRMSETAIIPKKAHSTDACFDLYADIESALTIKPHDTVKVGTGIATEIPVGYWAAGFARSGIATKQGLRPANCTMVIDADYRGEWIVALHNDTEIEQTINPGDRIAQAMILPVLEIELEEVESLNDTDRGAGGFGSSGK